MSQRQTSPSEDDFDFPPAGPRTVPLPHVAPSEPQALSRGRRSARTATRRPRRLGLPSPPPARTPADSTASSYRSVRPTIPRIEKKTMASQNLALPKSDVQTCKLNKTELHELYKYLQPTYRSPEPSKDSKVTKRKNKPSFAPTPPFSSCLGQTSATAQPSTVAPPAAQVSDWPLPLPIPAPPPVSFSSRLTAQVSAWSQRLLDSAPLPATSNSELTAQASAWPHWPPFTAPPPAHVSSGLAAQASARPHRPSHTAPPPALVSSALAAQVS
ncbi:hypothetical protein ROHU_010390 [Labeo rohita]|uniref:Uncharacterized protein n=1 Tax=Labeo rohita TaxID=84645 RepID=A0A498LY53_LABRO|nr:hypothetical protein ROHU_010390 [Labeo rohita]